MSDEDVKEYPNLKPFEPGKSGNPKGRPTGAKTGLRARLLRALDDKADADILEKLKEKGINLKDNDYAEVIAHVLIRQAVKGNIQSIRTLLENTESPMPKEINLTGDMIVYIGDKDAGNL
jgi:hypothetical protein